MKNVEKEEYEAKYTEFFKEVMYRFKVEMANLREIEN